ncbi:MAG: DMT family transporter [Solirubrobacteraceae bacterium]|nr:DMT family transporter [Solirubrobacteraceae bacterium]
MGALALALVAASCWGLGDFVAGLQARARSAAAVVALSQLVGLAILVGVVAIATPPAPSGEDAVAAAIAGLAVAAAMVALYHGLATGPMSVVAPLSATGAGLAAIVSLVDGDRPAAAQLAGMAVALIGVIVITSRAEHGGGVTRPVVGGGVALGVVAAISFGVYYVAMERAAAGGVLQALTIARAAGVCGLALLLLGASKGRRPRRSPGGLWPLIAIGLLDMAANAGYALASTLGSLGVVAVLASLYPAVTVLLAAALLREKMPALRVAGAIGVFAGVALMVAG